MKCVATFGASRQLEALIFGAFAAVTDCTFLNGRDARHDAQWTTDRVDVDPGGCTLVVAALQMLRNVAGVLNVLNAAGHLAG